jgi:hypothetical protein
MHPLSRLAHAVRHSVLATAVAGVVAISALSLTGSSAHLAAATTNPITPGNFTGYGFDQCDAPSQAAMSAWRASSPFRAAGIYISGALRFCQAQKNLTPTWVSTQLAAGWHLLPIHLGAQASCTTRDRYLSDRISADPTSTYAAARSQGRAEARTAVAAAQRLGIVARSTLFYDLEAFNIKVASCKASSLWFLSAWTNQVHALGYTSGVYSSAASGIRALDDARVDPASTVALPDQIWIADWNKTASTASTYIRPDGWNGSRVHQYQGGHDEKWGGVTINIDRDYLDLRGQAATPPPVTTPEGSKLYDARCTTASINRSAYRYVTRTRRPGMVAPLQCLLKQRGLYTWQVTGKWNSMTTSAVATWQRRVKHPVQAGFTRADWVSLLSSGNAGTTLKPGVRGADVIRAQRTLNAAGSAALRITGVYDATTQQAARQYQVANRITPSQGIIARITWGAFAAGRW